MNADFKKLREALLDKPLREGMKETLPQFTELNEIAEKSIKQLFGISEGIIESLFSTRLMGYDGGIFEKDISAMNKMYNVPTPKEPEAPTSARLEELRKILMEEVKELDEIHELAVATEEMKRHDPDPYAVKNNEIEIMVQLTDLMCDLIVYCTSEMHRMGLRMSPYMMAVMNSNFTKLGENGPIWKDGKFQKGPNYKKPEPAIKELILKAMEISRREQ